MGGIGHCTRSLVRAIAEADGRHDYVLVTTDRGGAGKLVEGIPAAGRNFRELSFPAGMIDKRWEQLQLPTVLADNGIDLYHSPCFALPVVETTRARVATVHDVVFRTRPELVDTGLGDYLDRWTGHSLDVADAIVTVSEFSKREIVRAYDAPAEKVHVIYNGIGPEFHRRDPGEAGKRLRETHALPERFVLYVGSLEAKKNIDRLLDAFATLVEEGRAGDRKLVLAGGRGGQAYDVEAAIGRAGVREHVIATGYLPDGDIPALMNMADLFVFPSLYEGFGLPPLEAMACATPTVVSDAACLPEVAGDGALVAPAEDVAGLAAAIGRALGDEALRGKLSALGPKRASEFTWQRAARETLALYESLIGGDA
jgi:glycosyltransferase involved in cell wall biosynthesis